MNRPPEHWLARPETIRRLWQVFAAVLALSLLLQTAITIKGYFVIDGWFGFGALFGFMSCVVLVLVAQALGPLLKRDVNYYDQNDERDD